MIHRKTVSLRVLAVLLAFAVSACAAPVRGAGSTSTPSPQAAATAGVVDPIAPVASTEYAATLGERRETLMDRGLVIDSTDVGYYMDVQEARLRQLGGSALRLTRRELSVVLELPGQLNFEVGSAELSASARSGRAKKPRRQRSKCAS